MRKFLAVGSLLVASLVAAPAAADDASLVDMPSWLVAVPAADAVDARAFSSSIKSRVSNVLRFGPITTMITPTATGATLHVSGRF